MKRLAVALTMRENGAYCHEAAESGSGLPTANWIVVGKGHLAAPVWHTRSFAS